MNGRPVAAARGAEFDLLEHGSVVVDDEDLAFELLARTARYRVSGRVEPLDEDGRRFRVSVHAAPETVPALELDVPAVRAAVDRILGPDPAPELGS